MNEYRQLSRLRALCVRTRTGSIRMYSTMRKRFTNDDWNYRSPLFGDMTIPADAVDSWCLHGWVKIVALDASKEYLHITDDGLARVEAIYDAVF